jgi:hypothetical protein
MDNPGKLAYIGYTKYRQTNQNTTPYVVRTAMRKETQITYILHEPSLKHLDGKTNRTSVFAEVVMDITTWNSECRYT